MVIIAIASDSAVLSLTVISFCFQFAFGEIFYVLPSSSTPCPAKHNCTTLSHFVNYSNHLKLNTNLIFFPGSHNIDSNITIKNVTTFSMSSIVNTSSSITITCHRAGDIVGISFTNVTEVDVSGLNFTLCGYHRVNLVKQYRLRGCTFMNHNRTAVKLINSSAYITATSFISNSVQDIDLTLRIGAAIIVNGSEVSIMHSKFERNSAVFGGGAIFVTLESKAIISCSTFTDNHVDRKEHRISYIYFLSPHGGALYSDDGCTIVIDNSSFIKNSALCGGVLSSKNSRLFVQQSNFTDNSVSDNGGVIASDTSLLYLVKNQFINNFAHLAGGVFNLDHTNSTIIDSVFINNEAQNGGVIHVLGLSYISLDACSFAYNCAVLGIMQFGSRSIVFVRKTKMVGNRGKHTGVFRTLETTLIITDSEFRSNSAPFGAVIHAKESNINITNCNHSYNVASHRGLLHISTSSIIATNIVFVGNVASEGIVYLVESNGTFTTTAVNNEGSFFLYYSNITFSHETAFINCRPHSYSSDNIQEGGAITSFQSLIIFEGNSTLTQNSAENGGAMHLTESKLYIYGNTTISYNRALNFAGGIFMHLSELNCKGHSTVTLFGNSALEQGGGIHAVGSTIAAEYDYYHTFTGSKILFIKNEARHGGGLSLEVNSKLNVLTKKQFNNDYTDPQYIITFEDNSAAYGGAIYVADDTNSGICASSSYQEHSTVNECFFQVLVSGTEISRHCRVVMKIVQNSASLKGSNLYGGLFDRCTLSPFSKFKLKYATPDPVDIVGLTYFSIISNTTDLDLVGSDPVRVCFCKRNKPDCSYHQPPVPVQKGEKFNVSLVAVDQADHPVGAKIHSFLISNESGIGEGQLIQEVSETCTNLSFEVFSPHDYEELFMYAHGPCKDAELSRNKLQIQFLSCKCPIGFQQDVTDLKRCICVCDSRLHEYVSNCSHKSQTFLREDTYWITYVNKTTDCTGYLIYPYCPPGYCKPSSSKVPLNLNIPKGADAQCVEYRTGLLCGRCQHGFSLSIGSSRCIYCSPYWAVHFTAVILVSFLAGIALVALILVLNLTVAVGTINGIIFYVNVVNAYSTTFFPFPNPTFATVFVSWLNLEPGFDLCFIKNLDAYWKSWLQLLFPTYVIILIIMIILISERSRKFSQLLGRKNPVATLATLILLSYAKLLSTIIAALSSIALKYPGPTCEYKVSVWLPDATIEFLKGRHIALFIIAIFILMIGILYTGIVFFWQWILRFSECRLLSWSRNQKLALFIETYHAPYTPQNRYWTGFLLFLRAILYIASAVNVSGDPRIDLLIIGLIMNGILLLHKVIGIRGQVYKKWPIEILEIICYMNLSLLCLATFFSKDIETKGTAINISVSITFVLLLGVLVYHTSTAIIPSCKRCTPIRPEIENQRNTCDESSLATQPCTSTVIDGPKNKAKEYNCELRESLLTS